MLTVRSNDLISVLAGQWCWVLWWGQTGFKGGKGGWWGGKRAGKAPLLWVTLSTLSALQPSEVRSCLWTPYNQKTLLNITYFAKCIHLSIYFYHYCIVFPQYSLSVFPGFNWLYLLNTLALTLTLCLTLCVTCTFFVFQSTTKKAKKPKNLSMPQVETKVGIICRGLKTFHQCRCIS